MSFAWVEGLVSGLNEQKFPDGGTLFGFFLTSLDNKWPEAVLKHRSFFCQDWDHHEGTG